ncbi:MAG: methyl-accepting chemotaxis protein [Elusimicrobiota bacterium]
MSALPPTATQTQRFQRRTVLVKRHLQLKYAAIVFASVLFTALIVGGDVAYTMVRFISRENPSLMPDALDLLRFGVVKLALFMGIMFVLSLFVSHRIAGPIYRFERSTQTIATGDLTHRVSLRTGDDLMELQDEMNAMVSALQRLVQKDRTLAEHLLSRVEALTARLPEHGSADGGPVREELKALCAELKHLTQGFKV